MNALWCVVNPVLGSEGQVRVWPVVPGTVRLRGLQLGSWWPWWPWDLKDRPGHVSQHLTLYTLWVTSLLVTAYR